MRCYPIAGSLLLLLATLAAARPASAESGSVPAPKHRVAAVYFHRTERCPTCRMIGDYIEESIKTEFAEQLKDKSVSVHLIDYQDKKNAKYTKSYKITGPTLVLVNVEEGKVTEWKPMPKVWSLVAKKPEFFKYVQDGVHEYLEKK
jgi:thiol-disulfide isomerase/thioredoxin